MPTPISIQTLSPSTPMSLPLLICSVINYNSSNKSNKMQCKNPRTEEKKEINPKKYLFDNQNRELCSLQGENLQEKCSKYNKNS
jgi:hypothetical protein